MIRIILATLLLSTALWPSTGRADDQDATKLAQEILDKSTFAYESHDASAVAANYAENGVLTVTGKDKDSGTYKSNETQGREAIERFYRNLFRGEASDVKAKNQVEFAHFVAPDLLLIHGHFQPDTRKSGDEIPFIQVRVRNGDRWLILSLQVFLISKS